MLPFPRFTSSPRRAQKTSQTGFIPRFRNAPALSLAALLLCAPLSFAVSARSLTGKRPLPAARKPESKIVHNHPGGAKAHFSEPKELSSGYIIEMVGGITTCRKATKPEIRWMRYADINASTLLKEMCSRVGGMISKAMPRSLPCKARRRGWSSTSVNRSN
jgi:hypothetical protein